MNKSHKNSRSLAPKNQVGRTKECRQQLEAGSAQAKSPLGYLESTKAYWAPDFSCESHGTSNLQTRGRIEGCISQ